MADFAPARVAAAAAGRARWANLLWLLPVLTLYAAGLLLPLVITLQRALELGAAGWSELLHNSLFTGAALNTAIDSAAITVVAVLLAYSLGQGAPSCSGCGDSSGSSGPANNSTHDGAGENA